MSTIYQVGQEELRNNAFSQQESIGRMLKGYIIKHVAVGTTEVEQPEVYP